MGHFTQKEVEAREVDVSTVPQLHKAETAIPSSKYMPLVPEVASYQLRGGRKVFCRWNNRAHVQRNSERYDKLCIPRRGCYRPAVWEEGPYVTSFWLPKSGWCRAEQEAVVLKLSEEWGWELQAKTGSGSRVPRPSEFPFQLWSPSLLLRLSEPGWGHWGVVTSSGSGSGGPWAGSSWCNCT